ncbi:MAG: hypothetical protein GY729_18000 [Desulfobacteraceae bacterium]|nr:hypothetical protein [Desulfobacteraceae bacterium]
MKIILYETDPNSKISRIIQDRIFKLNMETHLSIKSLSQLLRKPMNRVWIAILFAATKEELIQLHSMRELFEDIKIILILPDRTKDTLSLGLQLNPRYFTYTDSDIGDVAAVVENMIQKMEI